MRGKKFDAHEKHFKELEIKLHRELHDINNRCSQITSENTALIKENIEVKEEKNQLQERYDKLLEISGLSDEDIQEAIKHSKSINRIATVINSISRYI